MEMTVLSPTQKGESEAESSIYKLKESANLDRPLQGQAATFSLGS
jgi:hypothetical protein